MGLRKIKDVEIGKWKRQPCRHPEHSPPSHIVLRPGTYEHTCPGCGRKIRFTVGSYYLVGRDENERRMIHRVSCE